MAALDALEARPRGALERGDIGALLARREDAEERPVLDRLAALPPPLVAPINYTRTPAGFSQFALYIRLWATATLLRILTALAPGAYA